MTLLLYSIREALASLVRQRRRLLPMGLGIVWGMASVMVLLALARGFEASQRVALGAYGERFILLRLNRAELDRAGGGRESRLMMDPLDVDRLRRGAPAIRRLSPVNMAYRVRATGRNGAGSNIYVGGVLPETTQLRNLPLAEGRFHNELDEEERRRVIVLGPQARKQLFGKGPAIGRTVRIAGFETSAVPMRRQPRADDVAGRRGALGRQQLAAAVLEAEAASGVHRNVAMASELFEVIGVLKDVEVQRESYVSVARMAFIPFATACVVFDDDYNTIYIEPRSVEDHDLAIKQFRDVMGARYGFGSDDRNAVVVYFDAIERAKSIRAVFGGIRAFLLAVGALILAVGGIGVMNVVLAALAARRFEIGLRKAIGATPLAISLQFFGETVIACVSSGVLGFIVGFIAIQALSVVPLPEGFSRPVLDGQSAALGFGLLTLVAVLAGVYPAHRAARLPPIVALKEGR